MSSPTTQPSRADLWARFASAAIEGLATSIGVHRHKVSEAARTADFMLEEFNARYTWSSGDYKNNPHWTEK